MRNVLPGRRIAAVGVILLSSGLFVGDRAMAEETAETVTMATESIYRYVNTLRAHIQRRWIMPDKHEGLRCHALILQSEQGEVLSVEVTECATAELAASVERAVYRASPLPLPKHPEHFQRTIKLQFVVTDG